MTSLDVLRNLLTQLSLLIIAFSAWFLWAISSDERAEKAREQVRWFLRR